MIGKTIRRIEMGPTDPEYGSERDDTLIIHFTDRTAMVVSGSSYEEVSLDWREADSAEVGRWQHAAQGRREAERLKRLAREEWLAISCEDRAARRDAKRASMGNFERMMSDMIHSQYEQMALDANRLGFGDMKPRQVRRACRRCGERECGNAIVETVQPIPPSQMNFSGQVLTIPKR